MRVAAGAYDDFRLVFGSGDRSHTAGAMALLWWTRGEGALRELQLFARVGAFARPERRRGQLTGLVGLIGRYDLGAY